MANLFQVKRTTVSGRTPNTSDPANTQYIDTGELALNLTDGKMFSSNGSVQFEVGANLNNLSVTGTTTVKAISANGSNGSSGQLLASNGTATYWTSPTSALGAVNYSQNAAPQISTSATSPTVLAQTAITVSGNPVQIIAIGDANPIAAGMWGRLQIYRDSTPLGAQVHFESSGGNENVPYTVQIIDTPGTGTFTYSLKSNYVTGNTQFGETNGPVISVVELQNAKGDANTDRLYTWTNNHIHVNGTRLAWNPVAGGANVYFTQQTDDNFVFYSTNASNGERPVFSIYANSNSSNLQIHVPTQHNANVILGTVAVSANGSTGTSGQVLTTNGSSVYWANGGGGGGSGSVTSIGSGNGLTGGPITSTGTLSVLANTGIVSNSSGVFVDPTYISAQTSAAYANAQAYADLVSGTAYSNAVAKSSNASNITSGTVPAARLPLANSTSNGAVLFVDSVSNTAIDTYAPTANSVKRAYDTAVSAYSNATAYSSNATNITSGTLDTARLPATANITTAINVGANINITTSSINVGNATVNSVVNSTSATITTVNANTVLANTVNAASFTTTAFTANTTGITPAANNTALGAATKRWDVYGGLGDFSGSVTVGGNLVVSGNTVTVSATSLSVTDNMIYMNNGVDATITGATGNGTAIVFTANNNFANGWDVFVSGVTPSSFNGNYSNITQANATHFIVANTNTDTYTSGGTARGKTDANPDVGFAAGYNDGSYHHAGFFRDATDGVFKVFDNYDPEPDASAFIDTSNATFRVANLQANGFLAAVVNATTSVNSALISVGTAFIANTAGAYHIGEVNAAALSTTSFSANTTKINLSAGVLANGTQGTSGQVLTTNGSNVYWSTVSGGGGGGNATALSIVTDTFAGNGSNTQFTLSVSPSAPEYMSILVGGVTLFKNSYSVAGATLTLSSAPVSGAPIEVTTYGGAVDTASYVSTVQPFSPFLLMGAQN